MDALRAIQLLTDFAYLLLGIAAVGAAIRSRERARVDVAILLGALAGGVAIQEIRILSCLSPGGCIEVPAGPQLSSVFGLLIPYALLRLVDDVADVPRWQMWVALVLLLALGALSIVAGTPPPGWLVGGLTVYVVLGTGYGAWAFARRALRTTGITRRRMAAVAWGCCLLAAAIVLTVLGAASPANEIIFTGLVRLSGLASGLCFWAGFFPPNWLSQTWRLPELLGYLRPTRLMAAPSGQQPVATDAMAVERLIAATAATTGARRVLLVLEDPVRHDLYLWGAPMERVDPQYGLIARVMRSRGPVVVDDVMIEDLPTAIASVFTIETLPRTALLVPVRLDGRTVGVLVAFAEKGPMFVEDDLEVVSFFAAEAAAVLRVQRYRQSVTELEALREADRLKDEFMAVVSHELRTPLTAISGYSDILLRKLSGPLNERQERQVMGVREASRRLLSLINDLLDVSKLEAGTLDLHFAAIDPQTAVARAAAGVRVIASTKGVTIAARQAPPGGLLPVRADDERLQQMLTNLLMNAVKFTPAGGSVWISASVDDPEASPTLGGGSEIAFRVEDTGVGLGPGQVSRVWDRFYQGESSSTRRFGGAGLGLSIVHHLAELHGGHVEATSPGVNRGSTFAVHLPVASLGEAPETVTLGPAVDAQPVVPTPDDQQSPPTEASDAPLVLVVEDDPHIATVLRMYLEADGYRVQVASDGQEAIEMARTLAPFAVTLDISLPKLDGWSVLNALKHEPMTALIPVIIVSIVDNRDFGLVLGAAEYIVKPIDHERLRSVLRGLDGINGSRSGTVLVVDDDPSLRDVLSSVLSEDGWQVATANDGDAALAAVQRERPIAIVLDLMMPRVDGFEVLRTLRDQPATRDVPIIVVTAKELTEDDRQRLSTSAARVILKQALRVDDLPVQLRELLHAHRVEPRQPRTATDREGMTRDPERQSGADR
jgi:signal transduction histidine kinase/DNA-binding response OmpR family regulator